MWIRRSRTEKAAPEGGASSVGARHGGGYAVIDDKRIKTKLLLERDGDSPNRGSLLRPDRRGAADRVDRRQWRDRAQLTARSGQHEWRL